jgi:hypothetical protein
MKGIHMKNELSYTDKVISSMLLLVAVIVIGFLLVGRVDQYMKNMAIADCAKLATFSTDTTKAGANGEQVLTRSVEPIRDLYKGCIEDKGYKTGMKIQ